MATKQSPVVEMRFDARPEPPTAAPDPPTTVSEPIAEALVATLSTKLDPGAVVSLAELRNQSHSSAAEFAEVTDRLATLLTAAGGSHGLSFTADSDDAVDAELIGAAYLVDTGGLEQWELFLALRPAGAAWTLWRAGDPIRLIRRVRPGQPQLRPVD